MAKKNSYKINPLAPFSDDVRKQLSHGESVLRLLDIKWDKELEALLPGRGTLRNLDAHVYKMIPQRHIGNTVRSGHMRHTKNDMARMMDLLPKSLLGAGFSVYCADKWDALFRTQLAIHMGFDLALPHAIVAMPDCDPGGRILNHLLTAGRLSPDWRDEHDITILMRAAEYNNVTAVQQLLDAGADGFLTHESKDGPETARDFAFHNLAKDAIRLLDAWMAKRAMDNVLARHKPAP